jgi:hypothetical protein
MKGEVVHLNNPTIFTIMRNGTPIVIDTTDPHKGLNSDCVALLGLEAIQQLGIDINYHMGFDTHKMLRYKEDLQTTLHKCDKVKQDYIIDHVAALTAQDLVTHKTTLLSERTIDEYNRTHPDEYVKKKIDPLSVDVNPALPSEIVDQIKGLLRKRQHGGALAKFTNSLPQCMEGVPAHMFKMKEDAKESIRVPCPKFAPAKSKLIMDWIAWAEPAGLIERAGNSSYASRLILAPKYKAETPKSEPPDGIRVAWAGVDINDNIKKTVATYTNAWDQLYKVANKKYKFSADGLKQYWSIPLTEEAKDLTAFH